MSVVVVASVVLYFIVSQHNMMTKAVQAEENARQYRKQWKMAEAHDEYQKAVEIREQEYHRTKGVKVQKKLWQNHIDLAMVLWYSGDSTVARDYLRVRPRQIDGITKQDAKLEPVLSPFKSIIQERLGDFRLFGGTASGITTAGQTRTDWYEEAAKIGTDSPRYNVIRWKQAILLSQQGDLDRAKTLLEQNPLPNDADLEFQLTHQLADAILSYSISEGEAERNQKLQDFQSRFSPLYNPSREMVAQPEILELLLFSIEFSLNDTFKREDWEALGSSVSLISRANDDFLRQYPGVLPFMRRFQELLIRLAALSHKNLPSPREKQDQIRNIVRILNQMRPAATSEEDSGRTEIPTLIFFLLPESNKAEEGLVVFYPNNLQRRALYPLRLTRTMAKQRVSSEIPPLDPRLLEQIAAEKEARREIRISWDDTPAWSNKEQALTEADYPYNDILPMR
jgi:hypothetical protein